MFKRLVDMEPLFEQFTRQSVDLDTLLASEFPYQQGYVKFIDDQRRVHTADHLGDLLQGHSEPVIKIEGFEKYDVNFFMACQGVAIRQHHFGPVTCHLFKSPAQALSFPLHTDPDDVVIVMIEGSKCFRSHEQEITLLPGDFMLIPKHYPHEAINVTSSLMLSIGLESFTREKL